MPHYDAPARDCQFILHEVLKIGSQDVTGYAELDRDSTAAIFDAAAALASEKIAPTNQAGDVEGCRIENGVVRVPGQFAEAYRLINEGGWNALDVPEQYGGQGLPKIIAGATSEMFTAANHALNMFFGLTRGAISSILAYGTESQKETFVPRLVTGEWSGTMNMTESQCGTDLGLMRTRAEPQPDGSYRITGQKIFISAGDHELSRNIVHLVLARVTDAPEGIRGVSLFIVPKYLPKPDGSLGARNAISVGKLENKMGIHGNPTCVLDYDGATGWLLGDENKGMRALFVMMNEIRAGVAVQGFAQADAAYQHALQYARERLQGRSATGPKNSDGPADPLIVHPDIRRSLLDQKSFIEGARALSLWIFNLIDRSRRHGDADAQGLVSLLTPITKGFFSDRGFESTVQAQQIFGGHGYIEETGASQFVRDVRITQIYEGANGIQALDLVGRKLPDEGGRQVKRLFELVAGFCQQHQKEEMAPFILPLRDALEDAGKAVVFLMREGRGNPDGALAGSYDFMHLMGHLCVGFMWAQSAVAALEALEQNAPDRSFYEAKLATGRYYMARQIPMTATLLRRIESGARPVMALHENQF